MFSLEHGVNWKQKFLRKIHVRLKFAFDSNFSLDELSKTSNSIFPKYILVCEEILKTALKMLAFLLKFRFVLYGVFPLE